MEHSSGILFYQLFKSHAVDLKVLLFVVAQSLIFCIRCFRKKVALLQTCAQILSSGSFPFLPPPPPPALLTKLLSPLADMLSWAVWFKFLLNKVVANTCSFILTSFSKQSVSWNVLVNCVHCLLTRERRIQWLNTCTLVAAATASTGGGDNPLGGGGRNGKDPVFLVSFFLVYFLVFFFLVYFLVF